MKSKSNIDYDRVIFLLKSNKLDDAINLLCTHLNEDINNDQLFHLMGLAYALKNDYQKAEINYKKAISINPNRWEYYSDLASTFNIIGDHDNSLINYSKALLINPQSALLEFNIGNVYLDINQYESAINHFKRAISLNINFVNAYNNLGQCFYKKGLISEAINLFKKVLSINPNVSEAWTNIGNAYREINDLKNAILYLKKALNLKPDCYKTWVNLGITYHELSEYSQAITCYDYSLSLYPDQVEGLVNKGNALHEIGKYQDAISSYQKALAINSDIDLVFGNLFLTKLKLCDWNNYSSDIKKIKLDIQNNKAVTNPFLSLVLFDDLEIQNRVAKYYYDKKYKNIKINNHKILRGDKIKVAYFSPDFGEHAVSYLVADLFKLHNREDFEIYGFSLKKSDNSTLFNQIKDSFDKFYEIYGLSNSEIHEICSTQSIDIAVDLAGYTNHSKPLLFFERLAPIQISYAGYLGGMASNSYDYIVVDPYLLNPEEQKYFLEKKIFLPCYQTSSISRFKGTDHFNNKLSFLDKKVFTFCCFNNNYKYNPFIIDIWARILNSSENVKLQLSSDSDDCEFNLSHEFRKRDVSSNKIEYIRRTSRLNYYKNLSNADLFLDTYPYNAGVTANDALYFNLPILTLRGMSIASRICSSILNCSNLGELIATSPEDYIQKALHYANNPNKIFELKKYILNHKEYFEIYNMNNFARNIEFAYKDCISQYQKNLSSNVYVE
jgi:protein O-GlcNAc transferase